MNATLPRLRPLAPLAARRRVVLTAFGGYALSLLTVAPDSLFGLPDILLLLFGVGGMVLAFLGGVQLMRPARLGLPEGRERGLDERQGQRLSQAHITASRLLGALFLLAALYFLLAIQHHLPTPATRMAWISLSLGAILFVPALPTAVFAWTEPDPPGEETEPRDRAGGTLGAMFGRRVPPHIVFVLSVVLALVCAAPAVHYGLAAKWLPALLWGAVAVWFAVDAVRAHGWKGPQKA